MSRSGVSVRRATWLDILTLVPRLRQADIDECEALLGRGMAYFATSETYRRSRMAFALELDGRLVAAFGVTSESLLSDVGHPWMFGTDEIEQCSRALITESGKYISLMLTMYARLENIVDVRNKKSIRWLRRMGFSIKDPVMVSGMPFHPFVMEAADVC